MFKVNNCLKCYASFNLFRWRHVCEQCGGTYCSDCIINLTRYYPDYLLENPASVYKNDYLCFGCWHSKIKDFETKYEEAHTKLDSIECYPETYKGIINIENIPNPIMLESHYHKNRDDSLNQLKVTAIIKGFNVIYKMKFIKSTSSIASDSGKGTYYYSEWKATGNIGILKK